ncbi:MAG: stage V sporulation protein AE [Syntrophothermaceae bacterium]
MQKTRVIIVTDGDVTAEKAVYQASLNVNAYPLTLSAGNPTPFSGPELVLLIKAAPYDPVVVMLDDRGQVGQGIGEKALETLLKEPEIEVLGVVAVASDTKQAQGVRVDRAVTNQGEVCHRPVDKDGVPEAPGHQFLEGDTVEILNRYPEVKVVGCGDLGKMEGQDDYRKGAVITTRCFQEILENSRV